MDQEEIRCIGEVVRASLRSEFVVFGVIYVGVGCEMIVNWRCESVYKLGAIIKIGISLWVLRVRMRTRAFPTFASLLRL